MADELQGIETPETGLAATFDLDVIPDAVEPSPTQGLAATFDVNQIPDSDDITTEEPGLLSSAINLGAVAAEEAIRTSAINVGLDIIAGDAVEAKIQGIGEEDDSITIGVASGVGQAVGDIATIGAAAGIGAVFGGPPGAIAGATIGTGVTVVQGVRRELQSTYAEVKARGGTTGQAFLAASRALPGTVAGEMLDLVKFGALVPKKLRKNLIGASSEVVGEVAGEVVERLGSIKRILMGVGRGAVAEGAGEAIQTVSQRAAIESTLDPSPIPGPLGFFEKAGKAIVTEETGKAAAVGFLTGGIVRGGVNSVGEGFSVLSKVGVPNVQTDADKRTIELSQKINTLTDPDSPTNEIAIPDTLATPEELAQIVSEEPGIELDQTEDGSVILKTVEPAPLTPEEQATKAAIQFSVFDKRTDITVEDSMDAEAFDAVNRIKNQIQFDPLSKGGQATKIFANQNQNPENFTLGVTNKIRKQSLDTFSAVQSGVIFAMEEKNLPKLLPKNDPMMLIRLYAGRNSKYQKALDFGMPDANENVATPGGLDWLIGEFAKNDKKRSTEQIEKTAVFMIAQRIQEKATQRFGGDLDVITKDIQRAQTLREEATKSAERGRPDVAERKAAEADTLEQRAADRIQKTEGTLDAPIAGVATEFISEVGVAKEAITQLESDPDFGIIQESARRYRQWTDVNLQRLVDKGIITQEAFDTTKENNAQYVAMNRVFEAEDGSELDTVVRESSGIGATADLIKRFKGSRKRLANPYISLMEASNRIIKETDRNDIKLAFTDLITPTENAGPAEINTLQDLGTKVDKSNIRTISLFRDGKKELWELDNDVARAIKNLDQTSENVLMKAASIPATTLRAGVTYVPGFAIRNRIRDTITRMVQSRSGISPFNIDILKTTVKEEIGRVKKTIKDVRAVRALKKQRLLEETQEGKQTIDDEITRVKKQMGIRGDMQFQELVGAGGGFAGFYMRDKVDYYRALQTALGQSPSLKENSIVLWPDIISEKFKASTYAQIIENQELATRLDEYKDAYRFATTELGYDDKNARLYGAAQSRDLIDFSIAGDFVRELNRIIPFTNAAVQGLWRSARGIKENPKAYAMRWSLFVLIPTLFERAFNMMSGDEEEYEQLQDYRKDLFWNFKVAPGNWVHIPKPYELGVFASGASRLVSSSLGNKNALDGWYGSVAKALVPIDEASLAGPFGGVVQALANKDFFRDRNLVPYWEEGTDLSLRNSDNASTFGRTMQFLIETFGADNAKLGRELGDARIIDFMAQNTFGTAGRIFTKTTDIRSLQDIGDLGLSEILGMVRNSQIRGTKDVEFVFDFAKRRGISPRSRKLKFLKTIIADFYAAETGEERDAFGKEARTESARLRSRIEKEGDSFFGGKVSQVDPDETVESLLARTQQ